MSTLNVFTTLARLTRDPEYKSFQSGGGVVNFGIAFTGQRKKNQQGQYEDEPCFVDCKAFDAGETGKGSRIGNVVMKYVKKGNLVALRGHFIQESWNDATTGAKRTALRLIVDELALVPNQQKKDGNESADSQPSNNNGGFGGDQSGGFGGGGDGDIPF